jgi:hypothetical protein
MRDSPHADLISWAEKRNVTPKQTAPCSTLASLETSNSPKSHTIYYAHFISDSETRNNLINRKKIAYQKMFFLFG